MPRRLRQFSSSHFSGAAHKDADIAAAHRGEKLLLFGFIIGVVDKGDLFLRDTPFYEEPPQFFIGVEFAVMAGGGHIAKDKLRQFFLLSVAINLRHIIGTGKKFSLGRLRGVGVKEPLIQRQLSAVPCYQQHIVLTVVYLFLSDGFCTFRQPLNHFFLQFSGSHLYRMISATCRNICISSGRL